MCASQYEEQCRHGGPQLFASSSTSFLSLCLSVSDSTTKFVSIKVCISTHMYFFTSTVGCCSRSGDKYLAVVPTQSLPGKQASKFSLCRFPFFSLSCSSFLSLSIPPLSLFSSLSLSLPLSPISPLSLLSHLSLCLSLSSSLCLLNILVSLFFSLESLSSEICSLSSLLCISFCFCETCIDEARAGAGPGWEGPDGRSG